MISQHESPLEKVSNSRKSERNSHILIENLSYVNIIKQGPTKPKLIPQCFVVNARSIVKPDVYPALYAEIIVITLTCVVFPKHGYIQPYAAP